jgi:hypothetical protein
MSYIINKTDGSVLVEVVDGTINQTATDITLIGKNSSSYGEFINENLVHILENFADSISPANPIIGQIWYDIGEGRLKVYDGSTFKVSGGTIVSGTLPTSFTQGDIWIDSTKKQVHFYDGESRILAGPIYSSTQGVSGFVAEDVFDTNQLLHTIVLLYVSEVLIGIYSKDQFIPASPIAGYSTSLTPKQINVGFNVGTYSGISYDVPVTKASALIAGDDSLRTAESFLSAFEDTFASGSITIQNSVPLVLGPTQNLEVNITTGSVRINSTISDQNFSINMLNSLGTKPSIFIDAYNEHIGLYTETPTDTLDVNGGVRIRGNLTVEGSSTTINTTNIYIEDLVFEIGKVDTPTDSTANGGGISLQAGLDGNKTWLWQQSTTAWTSSENIDLLSGKAFHIDGSQVLSETALGISVVSAPGLHSIGELGSLVAAKLVITHDDMNNISIVTYTNPSSATGTITLAPKGSGTVDVSSKRITSVSDPVSSTDAVNYQTLTSEVRTKQVAFYADTTGLSTTLIGSKILDIVYPSDYVDDDTICRIYCVDSAIAPQGYIVREYQMVSGIWSHVLDLPYPS